MEMLTRRTHVTKTLSKLELKGIAKLDSYILWLVV